MQTLSSIFFLDWCLTHWTFKTYFPLICGPFLKLYLLVIKVQAPTDWNFSVCKNSHQYLSYRHLTRQYLQRWCSLHQYFSHVYLPQYVAEQYVWNQHLSQQQFNIYYTYIRNVQNVPFFFQISHKTHQAQIYFLIRLLPKTVPLSFRRKHPQTLKTKTTTPTKQDKYKTKRFKAMYPWTMQLSKNETYHLAFVPV